MEEILLKLLEQSPAMAILALVIFLNEKRQRLRDRDAMIERETFVSANKDMADSIKELAEKMDQRCQIQMDANEMIVTAHQYQKFEHEQMIKMLDKMRGN